jgi:N-acetylmuramoyl-L-alanine amidase
MPFGISKKVLFFSIVIILLVPSFFAEAKGPQGQFVVVIDPGHGGKDEGVPVGRNVFEKDITLNIAKVIKKDLEGSKQVMVKLTRVADADLDIGDRVRSAIKTDADLFVSLHVNAGFGKTSTGFEIYFPGFRAPNVSGEGGEGSRALVKDLVRTGYLNESARFAQIARRNLEKVFPRMDRGLREGPVLALKALSIPSVVIEIGFSTSRDEKKKLSEDSVQTAVADALSESIREYFSPKGL